MLENHYFGNDLHLGTDLEPLSRRANPQPAKIAAMPKTLAAARARRIRLILFDVDGVLTDGKIWIFPAPSSPETRPAASSTQAAIEKSSQTTGLAGFGLPSTTYVEAKGFHAHDGAAISFARLAGIKTGIITKRISETVALRARDLKLDHVYQGKQDKLTVFREILEKDRITAAEACFVGDDVIDLPVLLNCGFAVAVKNARPEVKARAHWVTPHAGGDGAARDAVEYILKAQGKWKKAVAEYTEERGG